MAMPRPDIAIDTGAYALSLARTDQDLHDAQALRYDVFVAELGGQGAGVDHDARRETDEFDAASDHLILRERATGEAVGVYRVLTQERAAAGPGFYSASEYDLTPLLSCERRLLELGRSCVRADHRSGTAMLHLWAGLARYVAAVRADILFGVASLKGTDLDAHAPALSLLHHNHLAPAPIRPRAHPFQPMDLIPPDRLDRRAAMIALPSLVKSYLRLGGMVGEGAYLDRAFNCVDVCMIMDTAKLDDRVAARFLREAAL